MPRPSQQGGCTDDTFLNQRRHFFWHRTGAHALPTLKRPTRATRVRFELAHVVRVWHLYVRRRGWVCGAADSGAERRTKKNVSVRLGTYSRFRKAADPFSLCAHAG